MNKIQEILLDIVGSVLFNKLDNDINFDKTDIGLLLKESKAQAVFPLVFAAIQAEIQIDSDNSTHNSLKPQEYREYNELYLQSSIRNYQNIEEHGELHELMQQNGLSYVVLKGIASARYYPEPSLRSSGDVDFLVHQNSQDKIKAVLLDNGFKINSEIEGNKIHIAFQRPPMSTWEMHFSINGIPENDLGDRIRSEMSNVIETAVEIEIEGVSCNVPNEFHHGLILLLHTISHLVSEGIGLRHLCDWVLFASSFKNEDFCNIFEEKLNSYGMWIFAQSLTLLGIIYLGAPAREWATAALSRDTINKKTLKGLMEDILSSGNFGNKDANRYREIKYIADSGSHTVSNGRILSQGFKSLNNKVRANHRIIGRYKILIPIGYIIEGNKYFGKLIVGRRKSSGTKDMLREAATRKTIYNKLKIFDLE